MRDPLPFLGLALAAGGYLWYAVVGLSEPLVFSVFYGLAAAGFVVAAAGLARASPGTVAAGLSMALYPGLRSTWAVLDGTAGALVPTVLTALGGVTLGVSALVWATSPRRAQGASVGVRAGAVLLAASAAWYLVQQLGAPTAWFPGNVLVVGGLATFAATFAARAHPEPGGEASTAHAPTAERPEPRP